MPRIIAMLPTFNEAENIGPLLDAVLAAHPDMEALVVDDDSPDGTWHIVAKRSAGNSRVHLLHRTRDRGRGLAGVAGFHRALELGADYVLEMDADWSHDPQWIPALIEASETGADIVVGSRLVPGGGEAGRNWLRPLITRAANAYIRFMLRLPLRDATSGYRLFSRRCLEALPWEAIRAQGPAVLQEMQLAATARGFTTVEVPIQFMERRHGESTFNMKILWRSLFTMAKLRFEPGELSPPQPLIGNNLSREAANREQLTRLPAALAIPASWAYGLGRRADRLWKLHGPRPPRRLPVPVVCVGNLTVGGTGKTPFVRLLTTELTTLGRRPAIVSRGYGVSRAPERPVVVSDREQVIAPVEQAGDEPRLLAEACAGTPVVIHPNRARAGRMAIKAFDADTIVLDDGFQHDALRRELDIVLWDLRDEPQRTRLLPAGRLREGLGALRRAGAIVLTHREYLTHLGRAELESYTARVVAQLKSAAPAVPVFEAVMSPTRAEWLNGGEDFATLRRDWPWSGERVLAVSGLARPGGFETMLTATGADVRQHFAYPDHHAYTHDQPVRWAQALESTQAAMIVTTAKDAVKLRSLDLHTLPIVALHVEMQMTESDRWREFLKIQFNR